MMPDPQELAEHRRMERAQFDADFPNWDLDDSDFDHYADVAEDRRLGRD